MSARVDSIEQMFDHGGVAGSAALVLEPDALERRDESTHADVVRDLQARIRSMQRNRLDTRAIPTHPAIADLLPGNALQAGGVYQVQSSTTLALALLQGPSEAGAWCAVVGMPDFGVEAAAGLGLDLERLVLVPHPGQQWLSVVSALVDVVSVVLVRAPIADTRDGRPRIPPSAVEKLASRLRQREAVLVAMGDWPRSDAALSITASDWAGIGAGFGHLAARQVTVGSTSASWAGRTKSRRLWLPGPDERIGLVEYRTAHSDEAAEAPRTRARDAG